MAPLRPLQTPDSWHQTIWGAWVSNRGKVRQFKLMGRIQKLKSDLSFSMVAPLGQSFPCKTNTEWGAWCPRGGNPTGQRWANTREGRSAAALDVPSAKVVKLLLTFLEIVSLLSAGTWEYSRITSDEWSDVNFTKARLPSDMRVCWIPP